MDRLNAFVQSFRQSTPSFTHVTKGSQTRLRRRASAGDILSKASQGAPTLATRATENEGNNEAENTTPTMDQTAKKKRKSGVGFSFRELFRSQPHLHTNGELPRDPLPKDLSELDGLVNYHLGQLDRIRRDLNHFNRMIDQLSLSCADMAERGGMPETLDMLRRRIFTGVSSRNLLSRFVSFHLQELERILNLKTELGQGRPVPNLFVNLPTDAEWNELFK